MIRSVTWARQAGFENLNLDLIFGLPEQTLQTWQRNLELGLGLQPEHFSLYALSLEHGTPFGRYAARGLLSEPDADDEESPAGDATPASDAPATDDAADDGELPPAIRKQLESLGYLDE